MLTRLLLLCLLFPRIARMSDNHLVRMILAYNRDQVLTYGYGTWIYSHYAVLFVYFCLTGEPLEAVLSNLVWIYVLSDAPEVRVLEISPINCLILVF